MYARYLNAQHSGEGITAYSVHPGVVATELGRNHPLLKVLYTVGTIAMKSCQQVRGARAVCASPSGAQLTPRRAQGAATTMHCALTKEAAENAGG